MKEKMKFIMNNAWKLARLGQHKFGGKVSEYFQEALKLSWKLYKIMLERKGGDILGIADWFLLKEFGHKNAVFYFNKECILKIKKETKKAYLIFADATHKYGKVATAEFWVPKSVCF